MPASSLSANRPPSKDIRGYGVVAASTLWWGDTPMTQRWALLSTIALILGTIWARPAAWVGYSADGALLIGCGLSALGARGAVRSRGWRALGLWLGLGVALGAVLYQGLWPLPGACVVGVAVGCLGRPRRPAGGAWDGRWAATAVFVCGGARCRREGADLIHAAFMPRADQERMQVYWSRCLGVCGQAPVVALEPAGQMCRIATQEHAQRIADQIGGLDAHGRDTPLGY